MGTDSGTQKRKGLSKCGKWSTMEQTTVANGWQLVVFGGESMEIKVQDYAAAHGVSPEAIRKKLRRNPPELEGHVVRRNNSTWLDDVAQAYLDEGLERSFAEVSDGSMQRRIDQLQAKNDELRDRLDDARDRYERVQDQLQAAMQLQLDMHKAQAVLEAAATDRENRIQDLAAALQAEQEDKLEAQGKLRAAEVELDRIWEKLAAAEAELKAEKEKTWIQKLFGRK